MAMTPAPEFVVYAPEPEMVPTPPKTPDVGFDVGEGLTAAEAEDMAREWRAWFEVVGTMFRMPDGDWVLFPNDGKFAAYVVPRADAAWFAGTPMQGWSLVERTTAEQWLQDSILVRKRRTAPVEPDGAVEPATLDEGWCSFM